jgi:hypothetical protein
MKAVRGKMEREGVTAEDLARKLGFTYYLVKPWLGGAAFPKGENFAVLFEWVMEMQFSKILSSSEPSPRRGGKTV